MNETWVTVCGNVVGEPEHRTTASGGVVTNLRIASAPRRLREGEWGDGPTSFYDVACWNKIGANVASSVGKGDPVVVHGTLRVREWVNEAGRGRAAEITAEHIGHDLKWGTAAFRRHSRLVAPEPTDPVADEGTEVVVSDTAAA